MSDPNPRRARRSRRARRGADRGLTLPELLIAIVVIGLVGAVVTAGVSVTLRQQQATQGRVDVARWEQNLGMWLPDDLSSASSLSDDPLASPCGGSCAGINMAAGSNVLFLSWEDAGTVTNVSYRFMRDPNSAGYGLFRVACTGGSCTSARVLGDLSAPPAGWVPGEEVPESIIDVSAPASVDPDDEDGVDDSVGKRKVIVTVNGVPALDGVVRSSSVSVAAGGTTLSTLAPAEFTAPSFVQARSDCGGPITLVVDSSGSIGGQMGAVRTGVKQFVNLFDGTPTRLQIVDFDATSRVLQPAGGSNWSMYFDLSEPGTAATVNELVDGISAGGYTNWEDALYRTFYTSDGTTLAAANNPAAPSPELVVFFTDGVPTRDRVDERSGTAPAWVDPPLAYTRTDTWTDGNTVDFFSPRGWWRADQVAEDFRGDDGDDVRMIGLGVGPAFGQSRYIKYWTGNGRNRRLEWVNGWQQVMYPHAKMLGNLVAGGDVTNPNDNPYVRRDWSAASGWGDVSTADVLVASDFTKFADALAQIALAECGGTLTVQTRLTSGGNAPFNLTYQTEGEQVTTSRVAKSGTFDIDLGNGSSRPVQLVPSAGDLTKAGYQATGWQCRARGADLVQGTDFTLLEAGNPAAGINLTVRANGAVSCTLIVKK